MHLSIKDIGAITMILFAVIDIPGGLPVLVDIQQKTGRLKAGQITLVSGIIMIVFLFIGESILKCYRNRYCRRLLCRCIYHFFYSPGDDPGHQIFKGESPETASIVPIAFPLIAGAGTLTTLLSLRSQYADVENIIAGILINLFVVYIVLNNTYRIEKLLAQGE
jgi:multiple antibiotic resistance protein